MNNIFKIMLGLACLSAGTAYAFTPSQSSCEPYVNSAGQLSSNYFLNNQPNIKACLSACSTIYGTGSDSATLKNISRCTRNLRTLSSVGNNTLFNAQLGNSGSSNSINTVQAPVQVTQPVQVQPVQATQPVEPEVPSAPPAPAPQQNNSEKTNQQIKWF